MHFALRLVSVRFDDRLTKHKGTTAVRVLLSQRFRLAQEILRTERVEHHISLVVRENVLMHPYHGIRRDRRNSIRAIGLVAIAQHLRRVGIAAGRAENLLVRHRRPFPFLDALLDVFDVHRAHPDQIGTGIDRVRPVGIRIESEVFAGNDRHFRLILPAVPFLVADHHALHFRVLKSPLHDQKPRHRMFAISA